MKVSIKHEEQKKGMLFKKTLYSGDRPVKPLWRMVGPVSYAADAA